MTWNDPNDTRKDPIDTWNDPNDTWNDPNDTWNISVLLRPSFTVEMTKISSFIYKR